MARSPNATHKCPLFSREVTWSECYEVQEIREDSMDMKLAYEAFEVKKADELCEKCRWCIVYEWPDED